MQDLHQCICLWRQSDLSTEQLPWCDRFLIQLSICILSLANSRSFKCRPSKDSTCLAVCEYISRIRIPRKLCAATERSDRYGDILAQCEALRLRKHLHSGIVVEHVYEIGEFHPKLALDLQFSGCDRGRGRPGAVGETGDDETRAETDGADHSDFEDAEYGEALLPLVSIQLTSVAVFYLCIFKHVAWDRLIHAHYIRVDKRIQDGFSLFAFA